MCERAGMTTIHEALIYLMVVVSASDRDMSDEELAKIGIAVRTLPIFEGFDPERVLPVARECQQLVQGENGLGAVMAIVRNVLPRRLHDTAYALAVEVVAADLLERLEELRVLQLLRNALELDPETTQAIERTVRARHRRLV
jgi:tellurite resistance protein